MNEWPEKENYRKQAPLDIKEILNHRNKVTLGSFTGAEGKEGFYPSKENLFLALGGKPGNPSTRLILCGRNGLFVGETLREISVPTQGVVLSRNRDEIGGAAVSRRHAKISLSAQGVYQIEDLNSANGTDVIKPVPIKTKSAEKEYRGRILAIPLETKGLSIKIKLGNNEISARNIPDLGLVTTDSTPSRRGQVQKLFTLDNNEALTIGGNKAPTLEHLIGERLFLRDATLSAEEIRLFIKDGNLYIINLGNKTLKISTELPKKPIRAHPAQEQQTKKGLDEGSFRAGLKVRIAEMKTKGKHTGQIRRQLAREVHPDLNPDDPFAKRKFQILSELMF